MRRSRSRLSILAAAGLAVAALATPSWAIISSEQNMDYYMVQDGQNSQYAPAIVKQWSFQTSFNYTVQNGVLTSASLAIDPYAVAFSTAELIAPQYIITAAHCVQPYGWMQYDIGGQVYRGERWFTPGDYGGAPLTNGGTDIAIVKLDRPVPAAGQPGGVQPMQYADINDPDYRYNPTVPDRDHTTKFTLLGYGLTNDGFNVANFYDGGLLRKGANTFDLAYPTAGYLDNNLFLNYDLDLQDQSTWNGPGGLKFNEPIGPGNDNPGEAIIDHGDSGGPDIVDGKIVGIHDLGAVYDGKLVAADTDVRRFGTWLRALVDHQNASMGPTNTQANGAVDMAFGGYDYGIAGISIPDMFSGPNPAALMAWLVANGWLDPTTLFGAGSPWDPSFNWTTGLATSDQDKLTALASATPGGTGLTKDQQDALLSTLMTGQSGEDFANLSGIPRGIASGNWKSLSDQLDGNEQAFIAYLAQLIATGHFGPKEHPGWFMFNGYKITPDVLLQMNSLHFNPIMLGEGGTYPGGFIQATVPTPEPTSLALLSLGGLVLLFRRRRHHAAV